MTFIHPRMEKLKEPIQSTSWTGLEIDEQLEQLIDVNDTFFERIVITRSISKIESG